MIIGHISINNLNKGEEVLLDEKYQYFFKFKWSRPKVFSLLKLYN